jgi:branched-chain amino acid transport system substrate-binding protein
VREKGANAKFMGPDSLDSAEMVKIAGRSVVGSYYTSVAGPRDAYPETAAFAKKFKQRFGKDIESFGMYGYDATGAASKRWKDGCRRTQERNRRARTYPPPYAS